MPGSPFLHGVVCKGGEPIEVPPPQTLALDGTVLSISDGNSVDLAALTTAGIVLCDAFGNPIPITP